MSTAVKVVCDGCARELKYCAEPMAIEVSDRRDSYTSTKFHACSLPCLGVTMEVIRTRYGAPVPVDQTVRKGAYR